jgi:hypothetical protein
VLSKTKIATKKFPIINAPAVQMAPLTPAQSIFSFNSDSPFLSRSLLNFSVEKTSSELKPTFKTPALSKVHQHSIKEPYANKNRKKVKLAIL